MSPLDEDVLKAQFDPVEYHYHAVVCKHCGAICTEHSWKVHVMACPALARWAREQAYQHRSTVYDLRMTMRSPFSRKDFDELKPL